VTSADATLAENSRAQLKTAAGGKEEKSERMIILSKK
jgi:hypothetical protein